MTNQEEKKICEACGGTGELTVIDTVDPSQPELKAPVGTIPCPLCCPEDEDEQTIDEGPETSGTDD